MLHELDNHVNVIEFRHFSICEDESPMWEGKGKKSVEGNPHRHMRLRGHGISLIAKVNEAYHK